MCGINGIITKFKSENEINNILERMNFSIKHRGPDDQGIYLTQKNENIIGLAQVRLSILDLSNAGSQPMGYNADFGAFSGKYHKEIFIENQKSPHYPTITFNGEIYNYQEIKSELIKKGYKFNTNCDTEVILASYQEWGENCVNRFNGMWAFAIFDPIKNILFCSRDRLGKKPLYYYYDGKQFIFSSEIKGILENQIERILDIEELYKYLLHHYSPGESTLIKGIKKIKAANNFIFNLSTFKYTTNRYWDINKIKTTLNNYNETVEYIENLLINSVKIRKISDVPVGTYLSGGIDSSLISSIFNNVHIGGPFHTFNVIWENTIKNEGEFAKIAANSIGSTHHTIEVNGKTVLDNIYNLQKHYCDPIAEGGFIPNYFVSKYAAKYVKVILTGDGGDEIFGGYSYYNFLPKLRKAGKLFGIKPISKLLSNSLPISKYQKGLELLSFATPLEYGNFFGLTISNFSYKELKKILNIECNRNFSEIQNTFKGFDILNQLQYTDQNILLPECYNMKADKSLMASGIEGRAPFQDYRLVETSYKLNSKFKINNGIEKYIIKKIAEKYIPQKIIKRKKQGYGTPIYEWINNELKDLITTTIIEGKLINKGILNKQTVNYYLNNIQNKYFSTRIWNIFSLELYLKVYNIEIK